MTNTGALGTYGVGIIAAIRNLVSPGVSFTGFERRAIAEAARAAEAGAWVEAATAPLRSPAAEVAVLVATNSQSIREAHVDKWERVGLSRAAYAEIIGVVSSLRAIDTFAFGLGIRQPGLPEPQAGNATGELAPGSKLRTGFVPVPQLLSPSRVLSALPADHRAQDALSDTLYLSNAAMEDLEIVKDLDRAQLELVAARTSFLNDCFW